MYSSLPLSCHLTTSRDTDKVSDQRNSHQWIVSVHNSIERFGFDASKVQPFLHVFVDLSNDRSVTTVSTCFTTIYRENKIRAYTMWDVYITAGSQITICQHIWQQRNIVSQLINLWLTAIFDVFDRVIANRQTLSACVVRTHKIYGRQQ